jgi:hypothetical protein
MYRVGPYGPSMANSEGGFVPGQFMHGMFPRFGGGMPPQAVPMPQTGGPMQAMQQGNTGIMPPNVLTGGGYPAQMAMNVGTGGGMQPQQMPQNRLGGMGGGYNFGMGGYLR